MKEMEKGMSERRGAPSAEGSLEMAFKCATLSWGGLVRARVSIEQFRQLLLPPASPDIQPD